MKRGEWEGSEHRTKKEEKDRSKSWGGLKRGREGGREGDRETHLVDGHEVTHGVGTVAVDDVH